jgi:UDP-N-acetylmuramyl pentapeptide phosphotransferase/UDP-N-acetylglucosamine-1-phosphate transferase
MNLLEYFLIFSGFLVLSTIYIKLAIKYNIVDIPNKRSSHSNITVRGGGIIFPMSTLVWFIYSGFQFPWFFTGLIIISIISFVDDLSSISFKSRLFVHITALVLLFIQIPLSDLPWWSWIPILTVSTGIINAFNFMDGINGITGGYSLSVLMGIWIVNNYQVEFISNELIYFTMIALTIFNFQNFRTHALCFAGDIGSISIAYIIVFLIAKLIIQSENFLYILFLSLYGIDTVSTLIQRVIQKENIFVAHRKHLYQLLVNELKISHLKVAMIYSFMQFIICIVIIFISNKYLSLTSGLITGISILFIITLVSHYLRIQIIEKAIKR